MRQPTWHKLTHQFRSIYESNINLASEWSTNKLINRYEIKWFDWFFFAVNAIPFLFGYCGIIKSSVFIMFVHVSGAFHNILQWMMMAWIYEILDDIPTVENHKHRINIEIHLIISKFNWNNLISTCSSITMYYIRIVWVGSQYNAFIYMKRYACVRVFVFMSNCTTGTSRTGTQNVYAFICQFLVNFLPCFLEYSKSSRLYQFNHGLLCWLTWLNEKSMKIDSSSAHEIFRKKYPETILMVVYWQIFDLLLFCNIVWSLSEFCLLKSEKWKFVCLICA